MGAEEEHLDFFTQGSCPAATHRAFYICRFGSIVVGGDVTGGNLLSVFAGTGERDTLNFGRSHSLSFSYVFVCIVGINIDTNCVYEAVRGTPSFGGLVLQRPKVIFQGALVFVDLFFLTGV